ncbi:TKL protein kinase, variant 1 [Capsaspora owczarzaki ATCC 30864]|uniref:receptor protein-tyrosine kinase n=1 Tax=Capsaspora owczarzaki (strain ATCC 30864) TaxID=595528 RepID=A0A0D2WMC9_CAPO3|nr:TKL protein kinase, variant 1 [Capsaspora owczarzaki ATCC 30864]
MNAKERELYRDVQNATEWLLMGMKQIGDAGAEVIAEALKEVNTSLTGLSLYQNQIGDVGAQALADALKVSSTVKELLLGGNQIGNAGARAIAEALKVNRTLVVLHLTQNQIGNDGVQAIAEALQMNTTLTYLNLQSNCIGSVGVQAIEEARKVNCTSEVHLDNQINPLAFSTFPQCATAEDTQTVFNLLMSGQELENEFASLPTLPAEIAERIMDEAYYWQGVQFTKRDLFSSNHPDHFLKATVPRSINGSSIRVKAIQVLRDSADATNGDLFHVIVRDEQGAARYECSAKPTFVDSTIELATIWPASHLIIRQMREGWEVQVRPSEFPYDVLQREVYDKVMNASGYTLMREYRLGDAGAQAIAEALKVNTGVTTLVLGENQIGDAGAQAIGEALKVNRTLTELLLSENQIGDAGAQAVADALKVNTSLTELSLDQNHISDAGAQAIAEALIVSTTLNSLFLRQNQIGNAGAQAIAEALTKNTTLTELHLSTNQIGDAGAQAIAEALKMNAMVTEIGLRENHIGNAGAQAIADALKVNTTLRYLNLSQNCIGSVGVRAIDKAHKGNNTHAIRIDGQISPLVFSTLPRFATAEEIQTVFCLLTSGLELEDQLASLPALPDELAERIVDEACYWQGVQHTKREWFADDTPDSILKVTVPRTIDGNSIRVKAIQVLRDWNKQPRTTGDIVFDWIVRDEQGAVQYECASSPTLVDSTVALVTLQPPGHPIIRRMREGWQVQVRRSKSVQDMRFDSSSSSSSSSRGDMRASGAAICIASGSRCGAAVFALLCFAVLSCVFSSAHAAPGPGGGSVAVNLSSPPVAVPLTPYSVNVSWIGSFSSSGSLSYFLSGAGLWTTSGGGGEGEIGRRSALPGGSINGLSVIVSELAPFTAYTWTVTARTVNGDQAEQSTALRSTFADAPAVAPGTISFQSGVMSAQWPTVVLNGPAPLVSRCTVLNGGVIVVDATSNNSPTLTVTGVNWAPYTDYTLACRFSNNGGTGNQTGVQNQGFKTPPQTPDLDTTRFKSDDQGLTWLTAKWTNVLKYLNGPPPAQFFLNVSNPDGTFTRPLYNVTIPTSFNVTDLLPYTSYSLVLTVVNGAGLSTSVTRSFSTKPAPPAFNPSLVAVLSTPSSANCGGASQCVTVRVDWANALILGSLPVTSQSITNPTVQSLPATVRSRDLVGLSFATNYVFSLVVTDSAGLNATVDVPFTTPPSPPPIPTSLLVDQVTRTSVTFKWNANSSPFHRVSYLVTEPNPIMVGTSEFFQVSSGVSIWTAQNLSAGAEYTFSLAACSGAGSSFTCSAPATLVARTMPGSPIWGSGISLSSSSTLGSIAVTWSSPPQYPQCDPDLLTYLVIYQRIDVQPAPAAQTATVQPSNQVAVTPSGTIVPYGLYNFTVIAIGDSANPQQTSSPLPSYFVRASSAIAAWGNANISISIAPGLGIALAWTPPEFLNDNPASISYAVSFSSIFPSMTVSFSNLTAGPCILLNLLESVQWIAQVTCYNSVGYVKSQSLTITSPTFPRFAVGSAFVVSEVTSTGLALTLPIATSPSHAVTSYTISVSDNHFLDPVSPATFELIPTTSGPSSYIIRTWATALLPNRPYTFTAIAHTAVSSTPVGEALVITYQTLPAPARFSAPLHIFFPSGKTVKISWSVPSDRDSNGQVTGYGVTFDNHPLVLLDATETEYSPDVTLVKGRTYQVTVVCFSAAQGQTFTSDPVTAAVTAPANDSASGPATGAIAAVVGSVLGVLLLVLLIIFLVRRRRNKSSPNLARRKGKKGSVDDESSTMEMNRNDLTYTYIGSDPLYAAVNMVPNSQQTFSDYAAPGVYFNEGHGKSGAKSAKSAESHYAYAAAVQQVYAVAHESPYTTSTSSMNRADMEFGSVLGQGEFGRVVQASAPAWWLGLQNASGKSPNDRITVAVKSVKQGASDKQIADFDAEGDMMKQFNHISVVRVLASFTDVHPHLLVLELLPYGDLRGLLQRCAMLDPPVLPTSTEIAHICAQVASGMAYLARIRFVHRDLAARNCLVAGDLVVKIADFGLSRSLSEEKDYYRVQNKSKLPVKWMAPESLMYRKFSTASDVWSFGVVCWEVATSGSSPYGNMPGKDVPAYVEAGNRLTRPETCPSEMYVSALCRWTRGMHPLMTFVLNCIRW